MDLPWLRLNLGSNHFSPLILLLLLSGQCPNPGPTFPCGVCNRNVTWGRISFQCTSCLRWVHKTCCNLRTKRDYDAFLGAWRCPSCVPSAQPPPPPALPLPPTPPTPPPLIPPPSPDDPNAQVQGHFLQFNTNGIQNSKQELDHLLKTNNILVACIQETKLTSSSNLPTFEKFSVERRDRTTGGGGGLITLVHHSVSYTVVDSSPYFSDSTIEHLAIEVDIDGAKLLVINVYIPPVSSVPGYTPDLGTLFSISTIQGRSGCGRLQRP